MTVVTVVTVVTEMKVLTVITVGTVVTVVSVLTKKNSEQRFFDTKNILEQKKNSHNFKTEIVTNLKNIN